MLLCSPIVLYDYPQVAPESAGDFYDATEMRSGDNRVRRRLQRTEESEREQLTKSHGTIRGMRPASEQ
jgi:hypothetical protein